MIYDTNKTYESITSKYKARKLSRYTWGVFNLTSTCKSKFFPTKSEAINERNRLNKEVYFCGQEVSK